jgi:biopolymer transport protein ExbD
MSNCLMEATMFGKRRRAEPTENDLNLTPAMNLILILIPLLLLAMETMKIAVINVSTPQIGGPDVDVPPDNAPPDQQPLKLTAAITDQGIILYAREKVMVNDKDPLGATIPKIDGTEAGFPGQKVYDWKKLGTMLADIKSANPGESSIIISAEPHLKYREIIKVMDIARETTENGKKRELFPDAILSAGVM